MGTITSCHDCLVQKEYRNHANAAIRVEGCPGITHSIKRATSHHTGLLFLGLPLLIYQLMHSFLAKGLPCPVALAQG